MSQTIMITSHQTRKLDSSYMLEDDNLALSIMTTDFLKNQTFPILYGADLRDDALVMDAVSLPATVQLAAGEMYGAQALASETIAVTRFYNTANGSHFLTANEAERDLVLSTLPSMILEGEAFRSLRADTPGADPVYRFYDTARGNHFYTSNEAERAAVTAKLPGFIYEGMLFHVSNEDGAGLTEVYRFFNVRNGDHLYTSSESERAVVLETLPDYVEEGIAFYVPVEDGFIA